MKLDSLDRALLTEAITLYLSVAWSGREAEKMPDLRSGDGVDALLSAFTDESVEDGDRTTRRFALRLGNYYYPHMKFVLEEYLLPGEFFFCVDTHDELDLKPDYPDFEAWQQLKEENRRIRARIEERWREASVPTYADLKRIVLDSDEGAPRRRQNRQILVVDDHREIADSVASILLSEGFDVLLAHDGQEAVETAVRERPDLILMDFQMPKLDGVEAAIQIRKTLPKGECRILLATAALIDLSTVEEADGFLLKPYAREILVSFIHALLRN